MTPSGYIQITGRIKDLIIRGGENIHPLEVENCILAHPGVVDVSVVGVKDERYGEVVGAFVIRKEGWKEGFSNEKSLGVDEVREWVRNRMSRHLGTSGFFGDLRFVLSLRHISPSSDSSPPYI